MYNQIPDNFCFLHQIDIFTRVGAREVSKKQYFEAEYFLSKYFLKSLKLSSSNESEKINLVKKQKQAFDKASKTRINCT